jgi:uncharacterized protein (TIGR02687 family)
MCEAVLKILQKKFETHRIVFWYDETQTYREQFEQICLPDVCKLEIGSNAFALKYRLLKEEPIQKFLLYSPSAKPNDDQNWLLDILLANAEFQTEDWAIHLSNLGLGMEYRPVSEQHLFFFNSKDRTEKLKKLIEKETNVLTLQQVLEDMLYVITDANDGFDSVIESLLHHLACGKDTMMPLIQKCKLDAFLFENMEQRYGYTVQDTSKRSIKDFIFGAFKWSFYRSLNRKLDENITLSDGARIFLNKWQNDSRCEDDYEAIAKTAADVFGIAQTLENENYQLLLDCTYFKEIDNYLIRLLADKIYNHTLPTGDIEAYINKRLNTKWAKKDLKLQNMYLALMYAARFLGMFEQENRFEVYSPEQGVEQYVKSRYKIDLYYRKFIYHLKKSEHVGEMAELLHQVEDRYSNNYLLQMNDHWQQQLDTLAEWKINCPKQRDFYRSYVECRSSKVCVIVSDALRYEIGEDLAARINQKNRLDAQVKYAVSGLPSYTQLGMAAVLPNKTLEIKEDTTVFADGLPTSGLDNRDKILKRKCERSVALKTADILENNRDGLRDILKNNDVIYVFHDVVDKKSHDSASEEDTPLAAEEAVEELTKLVGKLMGDNYIGRVLITADHGFIYQNRTLDESEYLGVDPSGDILKKDRRFVVGKNLRQDSAFMSFTAGQLGLEGDLDFQFPKSINRLRVKGAALKFVHGGASLQEVIVPVVMISKKNQDDIRQVDVDLLDSGNGIISSSQLVIKLYQREPVGDKVQKRVLKIGVYNADGKLISEQKELVFDSPISDIKDREHTVTLLLTKEIDKENNRRVSLILREPNGTNFTKEYLKKEYRVNKMFETDF